MSWDGLNEDFASRLRRLIQASDGKVSLGSGYRSVERQQQLWNAAVKKYGSEAAARKWVAPPGKSNHNHGVAGDLQGDLDLAHRLAPLYGLYFPMKHEPWHIEPVGTAEHDNPDAYTVGPNGVGQDVNRHDLTFQMANLIDILEGGIPIAGAPATTEDGVEEVRV